MNDDVALHIVITMTIIMMLISLTFCIIYICSINDYIKLYGRSFHVDEYGSIKKKNNNNNNNG